MDSLALLPLTLYGGETIVAPVTVAGYTSATHTLSYVFSSATPYTQAAATSGDNWELTVPATETVKWPSGNIVYTGYVTAITGGRVTAIDAGTIAVTASPAFITWAKTALAAVEAAIGNRATDAQKRITLGDMTIEGMTLEELKNNRVWLAAEARKAARASAPYRVMLSRFW